MSGLGTAKEFHRLMKRIGRLTDGQASIDNVDWDNGNLHSFCVTIRPNASYYRGGIFKFTIELPDVPHHIPGIWCETEIYHPNIDRNLRKKSRLSTNVCLDVFSWGNLMWDKNFGLEGLVIGLLFLMLYPNLKDPFSPEIDSRSIDEATFAKNVKDYMAGIPVEDVFEYEIDFRVIDGEVQNFAETCKRKVSKTFVTNYKKSDIDLDTNNILYSKLGTEYQNSIKDANETETSGNIIYSAVTQSDNRLHNIGLLDDLRDIDNVDDIRQLSDERVDTSDDDTVSDTLEDEVVLPVRFLVDEEDSEYFIVDFVQDS